LDLASGFLYFLGQVLCDQIVAEDAFVEDFLGFVGDGIAGNISTYAILLLDGCHDNIQEWVHTNRHNEPAKNIAMDSYLAVRVKEARKDTYLVTST
jgi:hypothetical protein